MHQAPDQVNNEDVIIVILEHAKSGKVMAVDKENDTVTLKVRDWNHFSRLEI